MTRLAECRTSRTTTPRPVERKLKVTVLSGGPSSEREVSLKSGRAVTAALESLGHDVQCADIAPDSLAVLDRPVDLVFIALHGAFGEDGRLQQILENRGIRYCGSGAWASALAMDKVAAKCRFIECEVPTPRFDVVSTERLDKVLSSWVGPVVIKPVAEGSSIDCHILRGGENIEGVLETMLGKYGRCIVEEFIDGLELTVGVLGDSALPPIQICTRRDFYNYEAKYNDNDTQYRFDIDLPPAVLAQIQDLSLKAHQALGCRDFSRVDWMVDKVTYEPYVLEVNTIPGFTDHSLLPKAAAKAGLSFPQLCQRIMELTLSR